MTKAILLISNLLRTNQGTKRYAFFLLCVLCNCLQLNIVEKNALDHVKIKIVL